MWFTCKIRFSKELENGSLKTMTEAYLVDALSFTEAEARLVEELNQTHREFDLAGVARTRLADVFHFEGGDTWFKVKVVYTSLDEKSGREKKTTHAMLVNAADPKQAYERTQESLRTMLAPFDITDVNTTALLEIFPYEKADVPANFRPVSEVLAEKA